MKVIVMTKRGTRRYAESLHMGFIEEFGKLCKEFRILDNFNVPLKRFYKKYEPDVIICYNSINVPEAYFGKLTNCPKVLIEIDFNYKLNDLRWYKDNKFDLVLQRGAFRERIPSIPSAWLPFSVDTKIFHPTVDPVVGRINKIGFMGADTEFYYQRRKALRLLREADLLDERKSLARRQDFYATDDKYYPNFLRRVVAFLTSTELNTPRGKTFEIMASGCVLLTPPFYGEKELFGSFSPCYVRFRKDCSNIVERAKKILRDKDFVKEVVSNALLATEYHTHKKRAEELYLHINNLVQGKPVERLWGL